MLDSTKYYFEITEDNLNPTVQVFEQVIKLDIPRLRQMEAWQSYDFSTKTFEDYCFYLH